MTTYNEELIILQNTVIIRQNEVLMFLSVHDITAAERVNKTLETDINNLKNHICEGEENKN